MAIRTELEKRIEKERQKITELQRQLDRAAAFAQGLQEAMKMLPKDRQVEVIKGKGFLRPGSDMQKVQEILLRTGRPMHITEILPALGKPCTKTTVASICSSLSRYVRRGEIFKRVGPNQFYLVELESSPADSKDGIDLPPDFGKENPVDDLPF